MTDFSSFFPSGGGGGVIINNFQTGSAAIEFDQLQAYSIVSNYNSANAYGGATFGPGNIQSEIPLGSYNTFATVADVTNSNGGAFCYAALNDSNHPQFNATSLRTTLGGNTIFKITLDGTVHLVHYRPTLGGVNISGMSFLGFPAAIRGGINTGAFHSSIYKYSGDGTLDYGTFWDAETVSTTTTFNTGDFTPRDPGVTLTYSITTAVPQSGTVYDLDSDGFPILTGGTGSFQGDTGGNQPGVLIDSRNYSVQVISGSTGGNIRITVNGAATVNADGSLTIPMLSTRLAGDNNRFTGKPRFQTSQLFAQETVRSTRIAEYNLSNDNISSNFLDPALHVTMGYPWVKFDSTCKVEMSHESQGNGDGSRPPIRQTNVGIYKF